MSVAWFYWQLTQNLACSCFQLSQQDTEITHTDSQERRAVRNHVETVPSSSSMAQGKGLSKGNQNIFSGHSLHTGKALVPAQRGTLVLHETDLQVTAPEPLHTCSHLVFSCSHGTTIHPKNICDPPKYVVTSFHQQTS